MHIGVFDSGIGGVVFARSLKEQLPSLKISIARDSLNMPYGSRTPREIQILTEAAIRPLMKCDLIVLACNTATAYAIDYLRQKYPKKIFVGFEPAIKTARDISYTKRVAVLATPATLSSSRYLKLKQLHGQELKIYEPDVSQLAAQIETNSVSWLFLKRLLSALKQQRVDTIVLGCTHYHLIADKLADLAGHSIKIITPTQPVINQIQAKLEIIKPKRLVWTGFHDHYSF